MVAKSENRPVDMPEQSEADRALSAELHAEQRWASAGEALSVININDKVIEAKEKELLDCIAQNYSRLKGVERELAGLQLQLRLTSGPKKSALELLRRKIELQNEKVVLARGKYQAARKVMEAAEEGLKAEEAAKDRLCQELNLLVQQSAHAQLERLEQLTKRMEMLNKAYVSVEEGEEAGPSSARKGELTEIPAEISQSPEIAKEGTSAPPGDSSPASAAQTMPQETNNRGPPPSPKRPELSRAELEKAAAARARHVGLKSPGRVPTAKSAAAARASPAGKEPFRGFD